MSVGSTVAHLPARGTFKQKNFAFGFSSHVHELTKVFTLQAGIKASMNCSMTVEVFNGREWQENPKRYFSVATPVDLGHFQKGPLLG